MTDSASSLVDETEAAVLRRQLGELTDAFVEANEQLLALYQLTEVSTASLDPTVAARRTVEGVHAIVGAEWSSFVRRTAENVVETAVAVGTEPERSDLVRSEDLLGGEAFVEHSEHSDRSVISTPVKADGNHFGSLVVYSDAGRRFTTAHLKLVNAVSNQLAMSLELAAAHDSEVRRTVMERDHDTASALAQAAMNRPIPDVPSLDLAAFNRPARAAGGDFYAVARCGAGLYLALGDVSGKGLPAALLMSSAISAAYSAFDRTPNGDAGAALTEIDRQLSSFLMETGKFITMAVAYVEPDSETLYLSNAGQSPVLLVGDDGVQAVPPDSPPIGVLEPQDHTTQAWHLGAGELLFIGSDGWADQLDRNGNPLSDQKVEALLRAKQDNTAMDLTATLIAAVDEFASGTPQVDDLTALVIRREPKEPDPVTWKLEIAAELAALREIGPWADAAMREALTRDTDQLSSNVELALQEICVNIIQHAYAKVPGDHVIQLECVLDEETYTFITTDDGHPYDESKRREVDVENPTVGGYGLFLAEAFCEELRYERVDEKNHWHLAFRRSAHVQQ